MAHHADREGARPLSRSSSEDGEGAKGERIAAIRYGGLKPKHLLFARAHNARQYWDSAEWASQLQGVVLQDVLPGGAPVDARPVKHEPTARVSHGRSALAVEAQRHVEVVRVFTPDVSTCDY